MDFKLAFLIVVLCSIFTALGISYLVIGNAYGDEFIGTLISAKTITKTSCSTSKHSTRCTYTYYVGETFSKNNSTNTCLVQRLTPYLFQGSADNIAKNKILYTKRKIWTTWYNPGSCYDQTIRNYYTAIGGTFIGVSGLFFLIVSIGFILDLIIYISNFFSSISVRNHVSLENVTVV